MPVLKQDIFERQVKPPGLQKQMSDWTDVEDRYIFEETFDPRIYQWCQLQTSVWRQNLTAEEYVRRERHLATTRICDVEREPGQEHGIHYYVLRDKKATREDGDSDLTWDIVASCETLHRKSWKFVIDDQIVRRIDVISPCIGAVHTIEKKRGRGVASIMLYKLMAKLEAELSEDNFISLYSEIGTFYDRFGFQRMEIPKLEFEVKKDVSLDHRISFIAFDRFEDLMSIYRGRYMKYIYEQMGADQKKRNRISIDPTIDVLEWHHARSNFLSDVLYGEKPGNFGAQLTDDNGSTVRGFIIFTHDYVKKSLLLILCHAIDFTSLKILLEAVQHEANKTGYEKISAWETDLFEYKLSAEEPDTDKLKEYLEKDLSATTGMPNPSVSAVKMLDGDNNIVWNGNSKFSWF